MALTALMLSGNALADKEEKTGTSSLGVGAGMALERKRDEEEETYAASIGYNYRFAPRWSIGGVGEFLGSDTVRDVALIAVASFHATDHLKLMLGPGAEFDGSHAEPLFRFGAGYAFHLNHHWSVSPEFNYDAVSGGKRTYILSLVVDYEF